MKVSPAQNDVRTNGTIRSTRGLSCGDADPGRVDHEPAGLGVLDERLVEPRLQRDRPR